MENIILNINDDSVGIRLDKYISDQIDDLSRSFIQNLIDEDKITINGKSTKSSYKLRLGDVVEVNVPDPQVLDVVAEDIPIDIIYEDDDVIVVNKPQGMVVHPAAGNYTGTLVNALMYHCGDNLSSINGVMRPGIVHRIDKNTSGLLVVCKNDNAHKSLAEQFEVHSITRIYTAICYGYINDDVTIDKPIARAKNDRKKMAISQDGKRAITHVKEIQHLKDGFDLIECRLETGRTHQIRVHLSSIKHPILGDDIYGPKNIPFNLNGQLLHAGTLGFIHPTTGEYVEFTSELPEHFTRILKVLTINEG